MKIYHPIKKILILAGLIIQPATALADETILNVSLRGLKHPEALVLRKGATNEDVILRYTQEQGEKGTIFRIDLNEPTLLRLRLPKKEGYYEILAAPNEEIKIKGRIIIKDKIQFRGMKVEGATYQKEYQLAKNTYLAYNDSIEDVIKGQFKSLIKKIREAEEIGNKRVIDSIYQTERGQQYVERVLQGYQLRNEVVNRLALRYKDSFMGPMLLLDLNGNLSEQHLEIYNAFSQQAKECQYGQEVKNELAPSSLLGKQAPKIEVADAEGNTIQINTQFTDARYLLVDFWASWCEPCRVEIQNLKKIYEKYAPKGLKMISITTDKDLNEWQKALQEENTPWVNYRDINRKMLNSYHVRYIPSVFVINNEGTVLGEKLRGKELADFIRDLFAE